MGELCNVAERGRGRPDCREPSLGPGRSRRDGDPVQSPATARLDAKELGITPPKHPGASRQPGHNGRDCYL